MAQFGSAPCSGRGGRKFESCHPDFNLYNISMKEYLDKLKEKYETKEFIKDDPIQFPHLFERDKTNIVVTGFIASIFAFGKREVFNLKLNKLLLIMRHNPYEFILNFEKNEKLIDGFIYRFYKDSDIKSLFYILSEMFKKGMKLEDLFYENRNSDVTKIIQGVYDYISGSKYKINSSGFSFMISNPIKGGANKRMNMFLRWMTRGGVVDFDVFDFIDKKDLIIPLDVHSGNVSRKLGLLKRNQNDIKAAVELTNKLKEFNPNDPSGYDFSLFGAGVNGDKTIQVCQI